MLTESEFDETQGVTLAILELSNELTDGLSLEAKVTAIMAAAALVIETEAECSLAQAYVLLRDMAADLAVEARVN